MTKDIKLSEIKNLVDECIKNNKIDFLSNLIFTLQKNYTELAELSTEGSYNEGWSHDKVLDYVTYESR
jgi:hypothetical protein